jgi:hypothetical protein
MSCQMTGADITDNIWQLTGADITDKWVFKVNYQRVGMWDFLNIINMQLETSFADLK